MFRNSWFIARKVIHYTLRSLESLLWLFVMPIVFFYFIGTVTGGFDGGEGKKTVLALWVPGGGGFLTDRLVHRLEATAYTVLADVVASMATDRTPDPESFRRLDAMPRNVALTVRSAGKRLSIPSGFEQAISWTLVMFTLLVLLTSRTVMLVIERKEGLLRRLAGLPPLPLPVIRRRTTTIFELSEDRMNKVDFSTPDSPDLLRVQINVLVRPQCLPSGYQCNIPRLGLVAG